MLPLDREFIADCFALDDNHGLDVIDLFSFDDDSGIFAAVDLIPNFVATLEPTSLIGSLATDSSPPELVVQACDNDDALLITLTSLLLNSRGIALVVAALQLQADSIPSKAPVVVNISEPWPRKHVCPSKPTPLTKTKFTFVQFNFTFVQFSFD
jgi:hypothetical protein